MKGPTQNLPGGEKFTKIDLKEQCFVFVYSSRGGEVRSDIHSYHH